MLVGFVAGGRAFEAEAFLFDKDGTLVLFDHWPLVMVERARRLRERLGLSAREERRLLELMQGIISLPRGEAEVQVAEHLGRLGVSRPLGLVREVFGKVDREFPFEKHMKPAPGAEGLLAAVKGAGGRTGIVTGDSAAATRRNLAALGWEAWVDVVVGTDICPTPKPSPEPVFQALDLLGLPPERAVMFGDSPADLAAARGAGCPAIGVLTGLGRPEELLPLADALVPDLSAIRLSE